MSTLNQKRKGSAILLVMMFSLSLLLGGLAGSAAAGDQAAAPDTDKPGWWNQLWQMIMKVLRPQAESTDPAPAPYTGPPLPTLTGAAQLKQLLADNGYDGIDQYYFNKRAFPMDMAVMEAEAPAERAGGDSAANLDDSADYSELNTQVAGVDEADIVRTDGTYIYRVRTYDSKIDIIKAHPAAAMQYVAGLDYSGQDFSPREMYIDGSELVVIGTTWRRDDAVPLTPPAPQAKMMNDVAYRYPRTTASCRVIVYDLGSLPAIKETRTLEIEGNYLSSRKVDDNIYVLTNKYLDYYYIMEDDSYNPNPSVKDTAVNDGWRQLDYGEICYFPTALQPNYLVTAAFSLSAPERAADIQTCLGGGDNVYASRDYLYVALSAYDYQPEPEQPRAWWWGGSSDQITHLYRFALGDSVTYAGEGSVPGHILNQFSMDEYDGHFRICTTRGNTWSEGEDISKNNVYVLDKELNITGAVEDIAPGETIYSARFMGPRAYMVTFRTVDPLFVLDLSDPAAPAILGQLKIPGYSDYLHPYDENHIIGFGKNSVTYKEGAYYQGMKIALFDVSDPTAPIELHQTEIGDRGTESPLLHNHKALLFSREKNLLAFPVHVTQLTDAQRASESAGGFPQYGQFTYQGAYVYNLTPENGFTLEQRITHLSDQDYLKAGDRWYDSRLNVDRILYIGDVLYTVSDSEVRATDRAAKTTLGSVGF